ncbi:hypothetical protein NL676_012960 [Syzygium grande]|nr:hypothetical protein NL676_012960 [Syzygium grande]
MITGKAEKKRRREGEKRESLDQTLAETPTRPDTVAVPLDSTPYCPPPWRPTSRLRPRWLVRHRAAAISTLRQKPRDELPQYRVYCCSSSVRPLYQRAPIHGSSSGKPTHKGEALASHPRFFGDPSTCSLVSSLVLYLLFTSY